MDGSSVAVSDVDSGFRWNVGRNQAGGRNPPLSIHLGPERTSGRTPSFAHPWTVAVTRRIVIQATPPPSRGDTTISMRTASRASRAVWTSSSADPGVIVGRVARTDATRGPSSRSRSGARTRANLPGYVADLRVSRRGHGDRVLGGCPDRRGTSVTAPWGLNSKTAESPSEWSPVAQGWIGCVDKERTAHLVGEAGDRIIGIANRGDEHAGIG